MVGEARAYVQGESLKARAALLRRLSNSPIARGRGMKIINLLAAGTTGLLLASQATNADELRYHPRQRERPFALIPTCDRAEGANCDEDVFRKVWLRIVADNGESTRVDMNSIEHTTAGTTIVAVYTSPPNTMFDPTRLRSLRFDCA